MSPSSVSSLVAAFLASLVEFVEALTIVLAVGAVRGWKTALLGAGAAAATLAVLIALFGPHLAHLNQPRFKLIFGTLLLLFGLRWLRKAILRAAGVLALHDEAQIYAKEAGALQSQGAVAPGFDLTGAATAFNGVFIEGIEVVFIVLAVGATGGRPKLISAVMGATLAALLVIALGFVARHPLTKVPENALKLAVGVLVSAFGTFWAGEGMGLHWPGKDWATIALALGYFAVAVLGIALVKRVTTRPSNATLNTGGVDL